MDQIVKLNQIDEKLLNQEEYFQSLFLEACRKNLLTPERIETMQLEIIGLLAKEVERFTNEESSSIPIENAQDILRSLTYSMGTYLKSMDNIEQVMEVLRTEKVSVLFYKGMDCVSSLKDEAAQLLQELQKNMIKVDNYAYQDTLLVGIPEFFHDYQIEFGAFDSPGSIDYPLVETINLLGVEYIHEYLRCLTIENKFVRHFEASSVSMLLNGFHKDAEQMLINIFELVLINSLGCELAGLPFQGLNIPDKDLAWLKDNLCHLSKDELRFKLERALTKIGEELSLEEEMLSYCRKVIPELISRLSNNIKNDTLQEVFISFKNEILLKEFFEDGIPMEDEELRELIDELYELQSVTEKIEKIREKVQSLSDMIELLEECFYGSEYQEVFELLNETERVVLKNRMLQEAWVEDISDFEPEKEWQSILLQWYK